MIAAELITSLRIAGVDLSVQDGRLAVRAPRGALTDTAKAALAEHRTDVIALLSRRDHTAPALLARPRPERVPLTPSQRRLWFVDRLRGGATPEFNIPEAVRLTGPLDTEALAAALADVVARHEALRTRFGVAAGAPHQIVDPPAAVPLPVTDVSTLDPAAREDAVAEALAVEWRAPFDLAAGPVIRARLLRLGPAEHVFLRTVHHIAFDGRSAAILAAELAAAYAARSQGRGPVLPPLPVQPADVALWFEAAEASGILAADLAAWTAALAGAPTVLALPADGARAATGAHPAAHARRRLAPDLVRALSARAAAEGASLHHALLAILGAVLARHTGEDDLLVGTPVAGRTEAAMEGLVGCFVNTLAIRLRPRRGASLGALLADARDAALAAQAHGRLPFERLIEALSPGRDLTRAPLVQAVLALDSRDGAPPVLPDLERSPVAGGEPMARYDLSVHAAETRGGLDLAFLWPAGLFESARMEALADHVVALAAALAGEPDAVAAEHPTFGRSETALSRSTHRSTVPGAFIVDRIEAAMATHPDAPALLAAGRRLSYRDLDRASAALAARLAACGARPEAAVAIALPDPFAAVVSMVATLRTGAAFLVLHPGDPADAVADTLAAVAPVAVVGDVPRQPDAIGMVEVERLIAEPSTAARPPRPALCAAQAAYIVATSGTTGRRKAVVASQEGLAAYTAWLLDACGLGPDDRSALVTSPAFDLGLTNVVGALAAGGSVYVAGEDERRAPARALDGLLAAGVTWLKTTPGWLAAVMADPAAARLGGGPLRLAITGGERQDGDALAALARAVPGITLAGSYGPTETTISCTASAIDPAHHERVTDLGLPVAGATLLVLDAALHPVPLGAIGELYVAGPGLARGYRNAPGLTAAAFLARPDGAPGERMYRTGDLVRRRGDGTLAFIGRADGQLKIAGHRIEAAEVEAALAASPGVSRAFVAAEEAGGSARLIAWVAGNGPPPDPDAVRAALARRLPPALVPSAIVPVAALPLTANGKVDRARLPRPEAAPASRPPATDDEALLCRLFAEITGAPVVGAEDDFFALGGHSLAAMRLLARIRTETGVEPQLAALFAAPTPAAIAAHLASAMPARTPLGPRPRGATAPVSYAQQRLWFIDRLTGGTTAYNMPEPLRLRGRLDEAALRSALCALVARHESLRTTFEEADGTPRQVVHPPAPLPLPVQDLSALAPGEREAAVRRALDAEWAAPFDLERGPLVRARLLRLAADDHVLARTVHHIISDGWSAGVLNRDLAALYAAFATDGPDPLPPLAAQYADYAIWQRDTLNGTALEAGLAWWRRTLDGAPRAVALPTDRPRGPTETFAAGLARAVLPPETARRLEALAERHGATLFQALAAGFSALLGREAAADDLVLGTVVANRDDPLAEPVVGFFVNTVALRLRPRLHRTFGAHLCQTRDVARAAFAHGDTPFEQVVEHLGLERNRAFNPLMQVVLTLQNVRNGPAELAGLTLEPLPTDTLRVRFDIEVHAVEDGGAVKLYLLYNEALFDASRMDAMAGRLATLLTRAAAGPDTPLATLLEADEARCSLPSPPRGGTVPATDRPGLLDFLFTPGPPDEAILTSGERHWSRAALEAESRGIADRLAALNVAGGVVGVALADGAEAFCAALAIWRAGAAVAVVPPGGAAGAAFFSTARPVALVGRREALDGSLAGMWHPQGERAAGAPAVLLDDGYDPASGVQSAIDAVPPCPPPLRVVVTAEGGLALQGGDAVLGALAAWREAAELHSADVIRDRPTVTAEAFVFWLAALQAGASVHLGRPADGAATVRRLTSAELAQHDVPAGTRLVLTDCDAPPSLAERVPAAVVATHTLFSLPVLAGPPGELRPLGRLVRVVDTALGTLPDGVPGRLAVDGPAPDALLGEPGRTAALFPAAPSGGRTTLGGRAVAVGGAIRLAAPVPFVAGFPAPLDDVRAAIERADGVRDARVALEDGRLVAYALAETHVRDAARHRESWRALYDEAYSAATEPGDLDLSGWNDTATGRPIPAAEMRAWVEATVVRIRALMEGFGPHPRVAELGCGTGLLLTRLAPGAGRYLGVDISEVAIERLRRLRAERPHLAHVELAVGEAAHVTEPEGAFDIVVLNSVVQYLGGAEDFDAVLAEALRLVRPGGAIVLGDLRSLPLLPTFHAAVLAARGGAADAEAVRAAVAAEVELAVDPAFAAAVIARPDVAEVETLPKLGGYDNELSRFRYDVTIRTGAAARRLALPEAMVHAADDQALRLALTAAAAGRHVAIAAPDRRADPAGGGLDADALLALAEGRPVRWEGAGTGALVLHINPRTEPAPRPVPLPLQRHVNTPRRHADRAATLTALEATLRRQLPDHMVPSRIVLLDGWPLDGEGRIEMARLPRPAAVPTAAADAALATVEDTEVTLVAQTFAEILERPVAPDDDFFRIGGHSLLAIRVIARLRETARVDLPIGVLWQHKTARALGPWLRAARNLALSPRQRRATRLSDGERSLFLFPPALGFSAAYAKLAPHLPGVGLTAFAAPDGPQALDEDVGTIAELAGDEPIWLLGHSSGGQLAFLAARRLEALGHIVAGLVVLDSYWATLPAADTPEDEVRRNVERFVGRAGREDIAAVFAASEHLRESAAQQVIRYFRFLTDPDLDRTSPIRAPVHLILAQGNWDRVEDWSQRSGGCTTHRGAGAHAFMVDHPHAARNAEIIAAILAGGREGGA